MCGKALGGNSLSGESCTSGLLFQQRLGFLQVLRVKSFSKPAMDLGQHPVSFPLLTLLLPETGEACCCLQLSFNILQGNTAPSSDDNTPLDSARTRRIP